MDRSVNQRDQGRQAPTQGQSLEDFEAIASNAPKKMWLSDLSIHQPVFIVMLLFCVVLVGYISYSRLEVNSMPEFEMKTVSVSTTYSGAAPSEVETSITKPIEDAMVSISGVDTITSTSSEGSSSVSIEFSANTDVETATNDVRNKLEMVKNSFPSDAGDPSIRKMDTGAMPVLAFAIADKSGTRSQEGLRTLVDDELVPQLEQLKGVGSVSVMGGLVSQVRVEPSLSQLQAYGMSTAELVTALQTESLDKPAGRVMEGPSKELLLRTVGKVTSVDKLGEIPVTTSKGVVAKLKDLATVSMSHEDVRSRSRLNGNDSISMIVQKTSGSNTVEVCNTVKAGLEKIKKQYPDLTFGVMFDQSSFTQDSITDVQISLILGGLLAAVVVFVFFRDVRNTLVTVAGLPVVVLGTFVAMYALGTTLNTISLMALSLSVGLLIDDAIVVRENIFRHMEMGEDPKVAAGKGAAEIAMAVLAVTSTIVAVFLPIAFTSGQIGAFLKDFGLTVTAAVLISLIEAFTFAPMLSAYFFHKVDPEKEAKRKNGRFQRGFDALSDGYGAFLNWSLRHRGVVVGVAVVALVASMALIPMMKTSFTPNSDQGEFSITMEQDPGASLAESDKVAQKVEAMLQNEPMVETVFATVGSAMSESKTNTASVGAVLKERGQTQRILAGLREKLPAELPNVKISYNPMSAAAGAMGGGRSFSSSPILYKVMGRDSEKIEQVAEELASRLSKDPSIVDAATSIQSGGPQRSLIINRDAATDLGVSVSKLASTLRSLVNGETTGTFQTTDGDDVDIVVRLAEEDRDSLSKILQLPFTTTSGVQVPLSSLVSVVPSTETSQISREDRMRVVQVGANTTSADSGPAIAAANAVVASMEVPEGVTIKVGGDAESTNEAFASLGMAIGLSVAFMYMILASQFGSFVHPFTIMLALPFSIIGALVSLMIAGYSLDAMSMIGIILLMGLVTKNSILLVEFTNQLRHRGLSTRDAIQHAGPIRLRPILMTTLAMIGGMIPVAVGFGTGSEMRQPMGICVIGGVITSTVLTLIAVPVAYSLIDDATRWILGKVRPARPAMAPQTESTPGV